ncbi:MAG: DNA polymerase III subunit delta [Defluviitaleaceae bacterium]|nr:DNA polymerase III subunit delta [Defluviitaleaceae bacterium]
MEQKKLKAELARGELRKIYLLFGDERFLVKFYSAAIEKVAKGEKTVFDGAVPVAEIIIAAETLPFFAGDLSISEKRLIYVRDSKLFASGRKAESEEIAEYLGKTPDDTVIVFVESEVDRRTRLFKKVTQLGGAIDCAPLSSQNLAKWITRTFKERGKTISPQTINILQRTCGSDMSNLANEMDKLFHYVYPSIEITPADIAEICTPTLESRVFDLTKAVGSGRVSDALKIYRDMLILKESPIMILTMIIRQLRIMLLCKSYAEKNTPRHKIAKDLNIHEFVIPEALSHARRFSAGELISALENCLETDVRVKSGLIAPEIGVELLIIKGM